MGSSNRGGFDVAVGKGESTEYDFGLGLKIMMMGGNHRNPTDEIGSSVDFTGDRSTSSAGGCPGFGGGGENFGVVASHDSDSFSFKSWGEKLFTASQRQELERQKIIYKYMAASIPVPSELLIPINSRYPSTDHANVGGKAALDQEPWRCRRTDGKKWRCARDAAPDQKYCERHSHKTRPSRSRKLVESSASLSSSNPTRRINNNNNKVISSSTSSSVNPANYNNNNNKNPALLYQNSPAMFMSQQQQYSNSRYPYWFMKREAHHTQDTVTEPTLSPFFGLDQITSTTSNFMGNDQNQSPLPRQFLNAWSIGEKSDGIGDHDSSLLTLSMAGGGGGGGVHQENDEADAQLGMGSFEPEGGADISNDWMCSSAPGGPLAEALWAEVNESGVGGVGGCSGGSNGLGFMK